MKLEDIFYNFNYKNKNILEKVSDFLISPLCHALGGKRITCLSKETGNLIDSKILQGEDIRIEFQSSRHQPGFYRLIAGIFAIVILPITALGLIGKLATSNHRALTERYVSHKSQDQFTLEDRITHRLWHQFIEKGARWICAYSDLEESAHIQADTQMARHAISLHKEKLREFVGGIFFTSAEMLRKRLEQYQDQPEWGTEVKKALGMAREYEKWSYKMLDIMLPRFIGLSSRVVNDLALDLQDRLNSLELGESFLFPVTLKTTQGFHAITVKMKKEEDGTFSFTVYNVGLGSKNHPVEEQDENEIYPFYTTNISQERITNLDFLKQLVDQATFKRPDPTAENFYRFLNNQSIWGEQAKINVPPNLRDGSRQPRKAQKSGTCTWRSPLTAIKDCMSSAAYKAFVFAMKRDDIKQIYDHYLKDPIEKKGLKNPQANLKGKAQQAYALVDVGIHEFDRRIGKGKDRFANTAQDQEDLAYFEALRARFNATDESRVNGDAPPPFKPRVPPSI